MKKLNEIRARDAHVRLNIVQIQLIRHTKLKQRYITVDSTLFQLSVPSWESTYKRRCSAGVSGNIGGVEAYFVNDQSWHFNPFLGLPQYHDIPPFVNVKLQTSLNSVSQLRTGWHAVAASFLPFRNTASIVRVLGI